MVANKLEKEALSYRFFGLLRYAMLCHTTTGGSLVCRVDSFECFLLPMYMSRVLQLFSRNFCLIKLHQNVVTCSWNSETPHISCIKSILATTPIWPFHFNKTAILLSRLQPKYRQKYQLLSENWNWNVPRSTHFLWKFWPGFSWKKLVTLTTYRRCVGENATPTYGKNLLVNKPYCNLLKLRQVYAHGKENRLHMVHIFVLFFHDTKPSMLNFISKIGSSYITRRRNRSFYNTWLL